MKIVCYVSDQEQVGRTLCHLTTVEVQDMQSIFIVYRVGLTVSLATCFVWFSIREKLKDINSASGFKKSSHPVSVCYIVPWKWFDCGGSHKGGALYRKCSHPLNMRECGSQPAQLYSSVQSVESLKIMGKEEICPMCQFGIWYLCKNSDQELNDALCKVFLRL